MPPEPTVRPAQGLGADILGEIRQNLGPVWQQAQAPMRQAMGPVGAAMTVGDLLGALAKGVGVPLAQRDPTADLYHRSPLATRQRGEMLGKILAGAIPIEGPEGAAAEGAAEFAGKLPAWYNESKGLDTAEYFASKQRQAEQDIAGERGKESPELDQLLEEMGFAKRPKETGPFPYRKGSGGKGLHGPVTADTRAIDLPVGEIKHLPGANDERPGPGSVKYDDLKESIDKRGFTDESPISIWVNHRGDAFVAEGNNRLAHAARLNRPTIKAYVAWKNGAHKVGKGNWTPHHVAAMVERGGGSQ